MARLNIDVPERFRSRAVAWAREDGFSTVEEYVQALLLGDAAGGPALDEEQIEELLLGRLACPFVDTSRENFRRMRKKLDARLRRTSGSDDTSRSTLDRPRQPAGGVSVPGAGREFHSFPEVAGRGSPKHMRGRKLAGVRSFWPSAASQIT